MNDLAFYNAGGHAAKGHRNLVVLVRRVLRRVLRPIFIRQVEIFQWLIERIDNLETLAPRVERHEHAIFALRVDSDAMTARQDALSKRQEEVSEQVQTALAFGWDYVALVRRLATLEDQVAAVTGTYPTALDDGEVHPSILFPGLAKATRKPVARDEPESHSKVC